MDSLSLPRLRSLERLPEVKELTGLRGLAAFNVMLSHSGGMFHPWVRPFLFFEPAVDLFFCLSCFTLCMVYRAADGSDHFDWRGFAVARFARLYPVYLVITLATLAYILAWNVADIADTKTWTLVRSGLRQLLLVAAWPLPGPGGFWVGPAWSVSVEAFCYALVFPLLRPLTPRLRWLRPGPALMLIVGAGVLDASLHQLYFDPSVNIAGAPPPPHVISSYLPVLRGVLMFASGWITYALWVRKDRVCATIAAMTDAIALTMIALVLGEQIGLSSPELVVPLAPLLILGLMDGRSVAARVLRSAPLHALGTISYSLYLVHVPLMSVVIHERRGSPLPFYAFVVLSLMVAALSYWLIERPSRRWLRRAFATRAS